MYWKRNILLFEVYASENNSFNALLPCEFQVTNFERTLLLLHVVSTTLFLVIAYIFLRTKIQTHKDEGFEGRYLSISDISLMKVINLFGLRSFWEKRSSFWKNKKKRNCHRKFDSECNWKLWYIFYTDVISFEFTTDILSWFETKNIKKQSEKEI